MGNIPPVCPGSGRETAPLSTMGCGHVLHITRRYMPLCVTLRNTGWVGGTVSLPCVRADWRSHGFCSRPVQQFVPAEAWWKKPAMDKLEKCDYYKIYSLDWTRQDQSEQLIDLLFYTVPMSWWLIVKSQYQSVKFLTWVSCYRYSALTLSRHAYLKRLQA